MLLSCDDLINLLIVHKEFPNRTVTCRSCTEAGRHEMACTGHREKQTKGRPQTLREIQKGAESCNTDATMRRKTRSDTRTATRDKAQLQMCRKTKAGLKDELIVEFPETLSDELNLQPMRSGEPMHIHLQDGARPRKTTVPRQVAKRFENAANTTLNLSLIHISEPTRPY